MSELPRDRMALMEDRRSEEYRCGASYGTARYIIFCYSQKHTMRASMLSLDGA